MTKLQAKFKIALIFIGVVISSIQVSAQSTNQIQGIVIDSKGEPIIGASVVVPGTNIGTVTNVGGVFLVNLPSSPKELKISYIGYKTKTIKASTGSSVKVVLEENTQMIDEVVVTGYGTMKKSHLTGAVASVKEEQLSARPVADVGQALAGQVAGVDVGVITSPGATPDIVIRGYRSINNNRSPLFVVDGIPREDYNDIPVNEIQSVEVLKDAISTAIYGSRAANGVILITTKSGDTQAKEKRVKVGFSGFYGVNFASLPEMMNGDSYVQYRRDRARWNQYSSTNWTTGAPLTDAQVFTPLEIQTVEDKNYVDWTSLIYKNISPSQEYNLFIDNSTENTKVRLSAGYRNDQGYYPNSDFTRLSLGLKVDQKLFSFLDLSANIRYTNSVTNSVDPGEMQASTTNTYNVFTYLNPLVQCYDSNGEVIPEILSLYANPMLDLINKPTDKQTDNRLFAIFNAKVKLFKGLTFVSNFGWDGRFRNTDIFYPSLSTKRYMLKDVDGAYGERSNSLRQGITFDNYFNYNNQFKKHSIDATVVSSLQSSISDGISMSASKLPDDVLGYWNMGLFQLDKNLSSSYSKTTLASFIGRFQYSYDNKYMVNFSIRDDGSSVLSPGYQWGTFPAASVAWAINKESFFKVDYVSQLKLRASYGIVGSATIDPYQSYGSIYPVNTNFGSDMVTGYTLSNVNSSDRSVTNKELTWERSTTLNVGLDWGLLTGRISGYVEYYRTITDNQIFNTSLPTHTGFTQTTENVGSTLNTGIEANVSSVNIDLKNFKWTTDINFSTNKGTILSLKGGKDQVDDQLFIGKPWRIYYDNVWTGIWQINDPDLQTNGGTFIPNAGTNPGQLKFKDISGPNGVPDGIINSYDYAILGVKDPKWNIFMRNTFQYKGISLSLGIMGKFGNMISVSGRGWQTGYPLSVLNNYWTPDNPTGKYNLLAIPGNDIPVVERYRPGDYIRMQELSLSYKFKFTNANDISLAVITNNPFYIWKAAKDCIDPSAPDSGWQTWKSVALKFDVKF